MNADIIKLREVTGAGVMECKRALEEAKGNFDKAIELIHKAGAARAEKKKDRKTGAGFLYSYIHNNRVGVLLEVRCETDFVAKSDPFQELVKNLAFQVAAVEAIDVAEILEQQFVKDEKMTVKALIDQTIAKVGENIRIERFARFEI